ncbi:MAG: hypothetical protein EOP24_46005 [Hyphomicrobiales bacterium]|nr:MAG: hypothetical protein EOP24_46005 [Hyphomicrobiales bacterium]
MSTPSSPKMSSSSGPRRLQRRPLPVRTAGTRRRRNPARHDLAHTHACLTLFDTAGDRAHNSAPSDYSIVTTHTLDTRADLIEALRRDTDITVLPIPHSL